ncbi:MAG: hypothetical protein JSR21_12885 [Proteobacteria bacterium]|nr:hypothetical protein [Pseudomonadota bacterium]
MPDPSAPSAAAPALIGGRYAVDPARSLAAGGGGQPAFAAIDTQAPPEPGSPRLMALAVAPALPPRAAALQELCAAPFDGLICPLAHGVFAPAGGPPGTYVVCPAPPGPPVGAALRPWPEAALIQGVLRPVARVLDRLAQRRLTHRAIRLDNVFQPAPGQPVVLGAAWAAPPAALQPAVAEPIYAAMCPPAGRGDGSIADDVYALGVLLLALALGRPLLPGLSDAAVIDAKLAKGSFDALAGAERVPPLIADLARGMLAEDPEHRPPPAMLLDPHAARARRVAARPQRLAHRVLMIGGREVWECRTLAFAMAQDTAGAARLLHAGLADQWLRRGLGDAALASQVEDVVRESLARRSAAPGADKPADMTMVACAIAALDPLAPLCWNGLVLWPDATGAMLAGADADTVVRIEAMIETEAASAWAAVRHTRCDETAIRLEARRQRGLLRQRGAAGGIRRLAYGLNPLLPCASLLLAGQIVVHPSALLPALESVAAAGADPARRPLDAEIAAFLAARVERPMDAELSAAVAEGADGGLRQLRILAWLQGRYQPGPVPALAGWIAASAGPALAAWRSRARREALRTRIGALAQEGHLAAMLALLDDPAGRQADAAAAEQARASRAALEAAVQALGNAGSTRADLAARLGQEIAAALSLGALVVSLGLAFRG